MKSQGTLQKTFWRSGKALGRRFKKRFIQGSATLNSDKNTKPPGNIVLKEQFFETFWDKLQGISIDSASGVNVKENLCTFQKKIIIKSVKKI